jgi:putative aldouronate transport system permease protein
MESLLKQKKKKYLLGDLKNHWQLFLFILPALAYLLIFCYVPMGGVLIAFENYDPVRGIFGGPWVGWAKFKMFFDSYYFGTILKNTLVISLYSLVVNSLVPVVVALIINEIPSKRFKRFVQGVSYSPYFVSLVVLVGIFNMFLKQDGGLINQMIVACGGTAIDFLGNPALFSTIYVLSGLWQGVGWWAVVYVGALSNVPSSLHEAAAIDGANRWQRILHIDLPSILPLFTTLLILSMGSLMSVGFEKAYLMQNASNREVSEIIATYTYLVSFVTAKDFSFGTAVGLFNSFINVILLIIANTLSKKINQQSLF